LAQRFEAVDLLFQPVVLRTKQVIGESQLVSHIGQKSAHLGGVKPAFNLGECLSRNPFGGERHEKSLAFVS